jgi:hypothetical protein
LAFTLPERESHVIGPSDISDFTNLSRGFFEADPYYDALASTIDDSDVIISTAPLPRIYTRDANAPFERNLLDRCPRPTPAPALTPGPRPSRRIYSPSFSLRVLHANALPGRSSNDDIEPDYDDAFELQVAFPQRDRIAAIQSWARTGYKVTGISPLECTTFGHCDVTLDISPGIAGRCFCRFDKDVVKAVADAHGRAICQAPTHDVGFSFVYFSRDGKKWVGPVRFRFLPEEGLHSLLLFAPAGFSLMLACGVGVWGLATWVKARTMR